VVERVKVAVAARAGAETRARAALYVMLAVLLVATSVAVPRTGWRTGASAHLLLETATTLFALVVGVLALVRYYSRREHQFLFLGATFLGTAFFDGFHAFVSSPLVADQDWSWFAGRTFLAVFLFRLAIVPRPRAVPAQMRVSEPALLGVTFVATVAGLLVLRLAPLPASRFPGLLGQPYELIPGALFLIAAVVNLAHGGWRRNAFEHWLVLSQLVAAGGQLLFSAESAALYDAGFLAAHVLKAAGYACVYIGLLASVHFTYRGLEESRRAVAGANVALQREVHEREATERELQIRTAYLERLFEHAPEAIVVLDLEDRVQRVNAEFTRLFGYEVSEAVGRSIRELVVPESEHANAAQLSTAVALGKSVGTESVRKRKDGSLVDVSILGTPINLANNQMAVYGIYRDITDRKRAEAALRETAQRLEAIIRASPLAIMTVDGNGVVRTWNPAAEHMLGWTTEQATGLMLTDLAAEAQGDGAHAAQAAVLSGAAPSGTEMDWTRPDGTPIVVSVSTAPLDALPGGSGGRLLVMADITERRRAEEAMRQAKAAAEAANRAKSEFLASMSHELRTPLNSVIGFTRVLQKNKGNRLQPVELTYLERIAANGEHLLGLINNILDLSKIEAGMLQVELESTDLHQLVVQTVAQLEGRVAGAEVRLRAEIPHQTSPFVTDVHRLRQVLINLIGNALKFTQRGEIVVTLENRADSPVPARIHVSDTGIGIPADRLGVIFEAFEQADSSTSRRYGGTGLGLSISRAICEMLGYALTVESEVGKGSTFTIHLASADLPQEPVHA
jgi:PAS domain S-box-containing protein